jgi:hypothetical protein
LQATILSTWGNIVPVLANNGQSSACQPATLQAAG